MMALVDGELTPAEEARLLAQIAKDPALGAYVEEQKKLRADLHAEFSGVLAEALPSRLEHAVLRTPMNRAEPARSREFSLFPKGRGWAPWLAGSAMTAGVALGFLLAPAFNPAPIGSENGTLIARGALAEVLTAQLAGEQENAAPTRIGMSFRSNDGALCRTFITESGENDFAGIACREAEDWRLALLAPANAPPPGTFQQAGVQMPPILRESAMAMMSGMPLDAEEERSARESGWR
jgi:hypothetical protein